MNLQIKKLFILLILICFAVGCTQAKHIVSDVKEAFTTEKKDTPKAPAESKETKTTPSSGKKATPKPAQAPVGEVFGPK